VNHKKIFDLVKDELKQVESEFARQRNSSVPTINEIGKYIQEGGGKRIRPSLLLLCTKLCGEVSDSAIKLAAVVEFIHTATLVHDDIIDGARVRRGRSSVNHRWGNQITVLAGDWLYMQSFYVALQERNFKILDILIDLTQKMVEGELIQLSINGTSSVREQDVIGIAERKTAYLFSGCARIGGLLGQISDQQERALGEYGLSVGLAFQMTDDILDFSSSEGALGKPVGSDLKEGKITLPLVYLLQACTDEEARKIKTVLMKKEFHSSSQAEIFSMMKKYRVLEKAKKCAEEFALRAQSALNCFPSSPYRQALKEIPEMILARNQ